MKTNINENHKSSKSQKARILEHMLSGKSITPLDALDLYDCFRLSARISDIRKQGYIVYRKMVPNPNTGKNFAQYSM